MNSIKKPFLLFFLSLFILSQNLFSLIETHSLCVLFDAGETTSLLPVLKKWENEKKDFFVLVMGTAEKLLKNEEFGGKKLSLRDINCNQIIDSTTDRTTLLALENLHLIRDSIQPEVILVGASSLIQKQVLDTYPSCLKVVYIDNFNYDQSSDSFSTVKKVQESAALVLCPSQHVVALFDKGNGKIYKSVGKPSLEKWQKEVSLVNKDEILFRLGLNPMQGPIVTFVGGYGYGYDVINPLFKEYSRKLKEYGYQTVILEHPKVGTSPITIIEAMAISDYIVGYNSSVIFDAAIIGKKVLYLIPSEIPFFHFAIDKKLLPKVENFDELLKEIRNDQLPNLQSEQIPLDSLQLIDEEIFSVLLQ